MKFKLIFLLLICTCALYAQEPSRTRTRTIDYIKYDQLITALSYAPDKASAIKNLLAFSKDNFTPEDEEYYNVRIIASNYATQLYDNQMAMELLQEAIEAFEKHYPFYNRGYASVLKDNILQTYLSLARVEIALNLYDKAIRSCSSSAKAKRLKTVT